MKVYISCDMEGISGVVAGKQTEMNNEEYKRTQKLMMQRIDGSFDAAFFIGYHAQAGTAYSVLDHTYSGIVYQVSLNGRPMGETGLNAALARHFGVPVVLVTGHPLEEELERLRSEGLVDCLQKPLGLEQLAQVVARALKVSSQ